MYGLDLRDMAGLEVFVAHMQQRYERLDVLVNNATQTIRRPAAYYSHLMPTERSGGAALGDGEGQAVRGMLAAHHALQRGQEQARLEHSQAALPAPTTNAEASTVSAAGESDGDLLSRSAALSQAALLPEDAADGTDAAQLPEQVFDINGQQLDLRRRNSWKLGLGEVSSVEAAEVRSHPSLLLCPLWIRF